MAWWLVWTIVGAVVLLSVVLVAVPAMAVRRRMAELDRVRALAQERMTARTQKLLASSERVQATLGGLQERSTIMQLRIEALKAARANGAAALEAAGEASAVEGTGTDRAASDGVAARR